MARTSGDGRRVAGQPLNEANQAEMEAATATNVLVTPGRGHFHPGVAKVWAYVERSAGTPTLGGEQYNVTSVTDDGAANTIVTIANDFSHSDYVVVAGTDTSATSAAGHTLQVGSFVLESLSLNDGSTQDTTDHSGVCFGDQ